MATKPRNVRGLLFATDEAGYLVGCMAAMMAKARAAKQVIGRSAA